MISGIGIPSNQRRIGMSFPFVFTTPAATAAHETPDTEGSTAIKMCVRNESSL